MDKLSKAQEELLSNFRELAENLQIKPNFYLINKIMEFDKKLKKDIKNELNKKTADSYLDLLDDPYKIMYVNYTHEPKQKTEPEKFNYKNEKLFNKQFDNYKMINDKHIKNYHKLVKKILFY